MLLRRTGFPELLSHTALRRTVRYILHYGVPPSKSCKPLVSWYTETDWIVPNALSQPVQFPSGFLKGSTGARSLSPNELGVAFGFLQHLMTWVTHYVLPCIPLQVLYVILGNVPCGSPLALAGLPRLPNVEIAPISTKTWIEDLQVFLPHTWFADEQVAVVAAQHDKALVPEWLWNNLVTMVLLHVSVRSLNILRRFLCQKQQRSLVIEFLTYMRSQHGRNWMVKLALCTIPGGRRRDTALGGRKGEGGGGEGPISFSF